MQIVGQHQQRKRKGGYVDKRRPPRHTEALRLAKRHRDENRQQRDEQHRNIVHIPEQAQHSRRVHKQKPYRPDRHPEHNQHGYGSEIASHLRLYDPSADRNAPYAEHHDIYQGTKYRAAALGKSDRPEAYLPKQDRRDHGKGGADKAAVFFQIRACHCVLLAFFSNQWG